MSHHDKVELSRRDLLIGGSAVVASTVLAPSQVLSAAESQPQPILIEKQGSFMVGGKVISRPGKFDPDRPMVPDGQTFHGDHAYVSYQVPVKAKKYPLVFWHGTQQFSKTWETTPDGREGFQNIFLRRGHSVYLIDQPRRGNAGRSTVPLALEPVPDEQRWFGVFRVGVWPDYFPGVQFARDAETLNQYFRQITPDTGPFDFEVVSSATAALFERTGPGVLITHSQSGGCGWRTAVLSQKVRGIVAYEPGSNFVFPEGEVPTPIESSAGPLTAVATSLPEFLRLTRIPIIIFYGDNIPATPSKNSGADGWRARLQMARLWRDAVNKRGGNVTVVHLPEAGLHGNTHFPFSDLNNVQVADLMSAFLKKHDLE